MFGLNNSYSLQIHQLGYTLSIPVIVMVIVTLAEELFIMLLISLLGISVSAMTTLKANS
jgi:hypothetical protein